MICFTRNQNSPFRFILSYEAIASGKLDLIQNESLKNKFNQWPSELRDSIIKPITIPKEKYTQFVTSLEVDGIIMDHYLNQSYVMINEERITTYIEDILYRIDVELKNKEDQ